MVGVGTIKRHQKLRTQMAERGGGKDGLVAAAFSALTNTSILSQKDFTESFGELTAVGRYDIKMGHSNSIHLSGMNMPRRFTVSECENVSRIFIRDNSDKIHSIVADLDTSTVEELKKKIFTETGVDPYEQLLRYGEKVLVESDTLKKYSVCREATILLERLKGATSAPSSGQRYLDQSDLAPEFDCDFTLMADDGLEYKRGGRTYKRPYGWRRFALNVLGKYGNDKWLGECGNRTQESPGEWAVSFHGVLEFEVLKSGRGASATKKVFSYPDIEFGKFKGFEKRFTFQGTSYATVTQNRINPAKLTETEEGVFQCGLEDLRPYGICVRKVID